MKSTEELVYRFSGWFLSAETKCRLLNIRNELFGFSQECRDWIIFHCHCPLGHNHRPLLLGPMQLLRLRYTIQARRRSRLLPGKLP